MQIQAPRRRCLCPLGWQLSTAEWKGWCGWGSRTFECCWYWHKAAQLPWVPGWQCLGSKDRNSTWSSIPLPALYQTGMRTNLEDMGVLHGHCYTGPHANTWKQPMPGSSHWTKQTGSVLIMDYDSAWKRQQPLTITALEWILWISLEMKQSSHKKTNMWLCFCEALEAVTAINTEGRMEVVRS